MSPSWRAISISPSTNPSVTFWPWPAGEPQTPPLYLTLLWAWMTRFGDSVAAIRGLSAVLSVLVLPAVYWLAIELFRSRLTASVAVILLSLSPFQIAYAQEARSYSLWMLMLSVSTASLLAALRRPTQGRWVLYAVTAALALYTHLLSALVIAAHVAYVIGIATRNEPRPSVPTIVKPHLAAVLGAFALFLPWAAVIALNQSSAVERLDWLSTDVGHLARMISWGGGLIRNFVDFGWSDVDVRQSRGTTLLLVLIGLSVVTLVVFALYRLWLDQSKREWLLVFLLIGSVAPIMIAADLLVGGRRSTLARYVMPGYLGMMLAVAWWLATRIVSTSRGPRVIARFSLALIVAAGLASEVVVSRTSYRWTKGDSGRWIIDVANAVNQADHPLLISDASMSYVGNLLALSHRLDLDVRLQLVYRSDHVEMAQGFSTIFLFRVSDSLRRNSSSATCGSS